MKSKKITSEAPQFSGDLLGGARVKIPRDKTHAGQSGWASSNAWDIPANISTPVPVYAIASGKVVTFKDYGPNIIKINGKKLFGIGFTVDSNDGLPDVYYTHLKNAQVKLGDKVECGQLLGYVTDFPESSFDHVHIGIEKGRNIREFIDSDGKIKCVKGLKMNGKDLGSEILDLIFGKNSDTSTVMKSIGSTLSQILNLKEEILRENSSFDYAKSLGWKFSNNLKTMNADFKKSFDKLLYDLKTQPDGGDCGGEIISGSENSVVLKFAPNCKLDDKKIKDRINYLYRSGYKLTGDGTKDNFQVSSATKTSTPISTEKTSDSEFDPTKGQAELDPTFSKVADTLSAGLQAAGALKESAVYSNFGKQTKSISGKKLIPAEKNEKILSPIGGIINNSKASASCKNSVTIEHLIDDEKHYLQYCGMSNPMVRDGQKVSVGTTLGKTSEDVEVSLYNRLWNKMKIDNVKKKEKPMSVVPVKSKVYSKPKKEKVSKKTKVKDYEPKIKDRESFKWHDPLMGASIDLALKPFEYIKDKISKNVIWPTEKPRLKENIERIKKLL